MVEKVFPFRPSTKAYLYKLSKIGPRQREINRIGRGEQDRDVNRVASLRKDKAIVLSIPRTS